MKRGRSSMAWLHVLVLAALVVGMTACIETEPADDKAFLETVRAAADDPSANTEKAGSIPGTTESPDEVPVIEVGTEFFDMGFIRTDDLARGTIPVKNVGKAPLVISDIKTTCGCTQGSIAQERIPPGGETVINVVVDPKRIYGFDSTKSLTVYSNDPQTRTVEIKVHAKIKPEFVIEPDTLSFGVIQKGETPTMTAIMRQNTDEPLTLLQAQAQGTVTDWLDVSFEERPKELWQDPAKREYAIHATIKPTAPAGPLAAQILLQPDLARVKRHFIRAEGNVAAFYSITPPVVNLGLVNPGKTVSDVMRVTSAQPFKVVSATSDPAGLTLTPRPEAEGNIVTMDVTVGESVPLGTYQGAANVVIEGDGKQYTERIRIIGAFQEPGQPLQPGATNVQQPDGSKLGISKLPKPVRPAQHEIKPVAPVAPAPAPAPPAPAATQ